MRTAASTALAIAATLGAGVGLSSCGQNEILKNANLGAALYKLPIESPAEALLAVRTNPPAYARERCGLFEPASRQLVIQVDMVHGNSKPTDHKLPFADHMMKVCQITDHLAIILGTPRIYLDGTTAEDLALLRDEFERASNPNADPKDKQMVDFRCRAVPLLASYYYYGNFQILPTEAAEILNERRAAVNRNSWAQADFLNEDRENYVLDKIAATSSPVAIIVFGAAHDFTPNIEYFNKKNPQSKFSYLRLRPDDLPLDDAEKGKWIEKNRRH